MGQNKNSKNNLLVRYLSVFSLVVVIFGIFYSVAVNLAPVPKPDVKVYTPASLDSKQFSYAWPIEENVSSAVSILDDSAPIEIGPNGDSARPIASITKVVSLLVLLEHKPADSNNQGEVITFTQQDADITYELGQIGASVLPSIPGESMTLYNMYQSIVTASSNNYVEILGMRFFGSSKALLDLCNEWTKQHGLNSIKLSDVHGMSEQNVASPSDLVRLGRLALANQNLSNMTRIQAFELPGYGLVENTNSLIGKDGFIGLKTGYTDEAGRCLLFAKEIIVDNKKEIIVGVVLGASSIESRAQQASDLANSFAANIMYVDALQPNSSLGEVTTIWGESTKVYNKDTIRVRQWNGEQIAFKVDIKKNSEDTENYSSSLHVESILDPKNIELYFDKKISEPDFWWKFTHPGDLF